MFHPLFIRVVSHCFPLSCPRDLVRYSGTTVFWLHCYHAQWGHFLILLLKELMDVQNVLQVCYSFFETGFCLFYTNKKHYNETYKPSDVQANLYPRHRTRGGGGGGVEPLPGVFVILRRSETILHCKIKPECL